MSKETPRSSWQPFGALRSHASRGPNSLRADSAGTLNSFPRHSLWGCQVEYRMQCLGRTYTIRDLLFI